MRETQMMASKQAEFINYEIWILTFGGGFQRAGVYSDNVADDVRSEFRAAIRSRITGIVRNRYGQTEVSTNDHVDLLLETKKWIDESYSRILSSGEMRLGVVQKLINLYLKYQWCLGLICEPPHCPFDRIVISRMKLRNPPSWTKIDSVDTYKMLVNKASQLAGERSIAEWELDVFARQ